MSRWGRDGDKGEETRSWEIVYNQYFLTKGAKRENISDIE
jgi:hypothetical protein